jgi:hypothetical protein
VAFTADVRTEPAQRLPVAGDVELVTEHPEMLADQVECAVGYCALIRVLAGLISFPVQYGLGLHRLLDVLAEPVEYPLLGYAGLFLELALPCSDGFSDFRFCKVLCADAVSRAFAIPGPYSGLRGVEIDQVFLNEPLLLRGEFPLLIR